MTPSFPGADESTPSRSQYFSWINNTNEGATEAQTKVNLDFFRWLREEYGLELDIYALDAGAVDGAKFYGSTDSERFRRQFPNGFWSLAETAKAQGCRLGIWGGPDGFGDSVEEGEKRREMMVGFCRDHNFALFKMDAVCGQLRKEKQGLFVAMMEECRRFCPDLILLNHRLELGPGMAHATTTLFEGAETYIDVHMSNREAALHNRAGALARGLPPGLTRLTEDHGVCLSSCLDYWEDDLVLQAFNRCLILAPEIYGNPWLLRDDEYPRLARIFRLHRKFRGILTEALPLPAERFGPHAIARGSETTRFLTFRNLSWEPLTVKVPLGPEIGLMDEDFVHVRRLHPRERILGDYLYGAEATVEVEPWRSLLLVATTEEWEGHDIRGCDFEVVKDLPGQTQQIRLLGMPGEVMEIQVGGQPVPIPFPGEPKSLPPLRMLGELKEGLLPERPRAVFEASCFAADNNALEARELERSGATEIPEVQAARSAFFGQPLWRQRLLCDSGLFDDDPDTGFAVNRRWGDPRVAGGCFRLDLGEAVRVDHLVIEVASEYELQPLKSQENVPVWVSPDLKEWRLAYAWTSPSLNLSLPEGEPIRYVAVEGCPDRIREVRGFFRGRALDRSDWRASLLFAPWGMVEPGQAWSLDFTLPEIWEGSFLALAVPEEHGVEGVVAALDVLGELRGATRRAPSFPSCTWECPVRPASGGTTWFFPIEEDLVGVPLRMTLMSVAYKSSPWASVTPQPLDLHPKLWITAGPDPYAEVFMAAIIKGGPEPEESGEEEEG